MEEAQNIVDEIEEEDTFKESFAEKEIEEPKDEIEEDYLDDDEEEENMDDEELFRDNPLKAIWVRLEELVSNQESIENKLNELIEAVDEEEEQPENEATEEVDDEEPIN